MRFEKDFTSRHRLKEWLESKSWKFDSMETFYDWLEKFIDEGNILAPAFACWTIPRHEWIA